MSRHEEPRIYEVEIKYRDAGLELWFEMEDWLEMVQEDFTSFELIKGTFRTDLEGAKDRLREYAREVDEEQEDEPVLDEPVIQLKNPPQEWVDDPTNMAEIYDAFNMLLARMGLYSLMESELAEQNELIDKEEYKTAVVRQSAFFEEYLTFLSQLSLQEQKRGVLSGSEISIVEDMGHRDRIRLARLFGRVDEDEHGLLQEMANWRNRIAHTSWHDFSSQDESQIRSTAKRVRDLLKRRIDETEDYFEEVDDQQSVEDFLGFGALDLDLQLLQVAIMTALDARGGSASIEELHRIIDADPLTVDKRCKTMVAIGYLEEIDGQYRLTEFGREFFEEEIA